MSRMQQLLEKVRNKLCGYGRTIHIGGRRIKLGDGAVIPEDPALDDQRAFRDAVAPVRERIGAFLETYAKSRGITIVLEVANLVQAGGLVYVDPAADITRDFIAEYNKANPVTTSSAPAAPSAERPASSR